LKTIRQDLLGETLREEGGSEENDSEKRRAARRDKL
jgi:hypothetical protein